MNALRKLRGLVLKNYNGYYYVRDLAEDAIYTCKVKGRMKQNRFSLVTGDEVIFDVCGNSEGMITDVAERRNFLQRPAVANIDLFVVELACAEPEFSFLLADKLLALAERAGIDAVLVLNKCELVENARLQLIRDTYEAIGYEVFLISAAKNIGIDALREKLQGKICAFGGPSGVGKSSTINAVDENSSGLRTGTVSAKIKRGRHTTRYAQLLPFAGGYLVDTPGFGNISLDGLVKEKTAEYFREFASHEEGCRFKPCTHVHEPVCGVKKAVSEKNIAVSRYESYRFILQELEASREREGKKAW